VSLPDSHVVRQLENVICEVFLFSVVAAVSAANSRVVCRRHACLYSG
jgi:hypothetical protein